MRTLIPTTPPEEEELNGPRSYISPSRLNLWLKCPLAFRRRYVDGIESPATRPQLLGQLVHTGLASYYHLQMIGIRARTEDVIFRLEKTFKEILEENNANHLSQPDRVSTVAQARALVTAYLDRDEVQHDERKPLAVEMHFEAPLVDPFAGEDLGLPLVGILDLVLDDPSGPVIIDFKSRSRASQPSPLEHEIQLTAYSYLWRQEHVRPESAVEIRSLVKTKVPQIAVHRYAPRGPEHLRRFFEVVRAYLEDLDRGRFLFRPGWHCASCDFHAHCCGACAA